MEKSAIFHLPDKRYAYAVKKDTFIIRVRTKASDFKEVILHYQDKYIPKRILDTSKEIKMEKYASDGILDYYHVKIDFHVVCLRYFFEFIDFNDSHLYYGNNHFFNEIIDRIDFMFDLPQNLREEEMFITPSWANNKVVYQIFPSRFSSSIKISDKIWYKNPIGYNDNIGGNLQGIINHLDHIKELGVDVIYMTPIFKSNSIHKYDTIDYYTIEPTFGTKDDLKNLVSKAHSLGIKVVLDGVFNHTSPDFFAFKDIIKNKEKSEYLDWYFIEGFPLQMERGKKPNFKTFSYFAGMPKLNLANKKVSDYILGVAKYWIKECDIDGWRLDVGDEISHSFWKKFRMAVKEEKADAIIIGEVWHYAEDFLMGDEWDTVMNYDFLFSVKGLLSENRINLTEFKNEIFQIKGKVHSNVYPILFNLIDSHDTERFYHSVGYNKDKMKLAAAFQLLFSGMPMIYYGDEYGMQGGHDPDCRRGMYWKEEYQDLEIFDWYKRLISARKKYPFLEEDIINVITDDESGLLIIERKNYVLAFNTKDKDIIVDSLNNKFDLILEKESTNVLKPYSVVLYKK